MDSEDIISVLEDTTPTPRMRGTTDRVQTADHADSVLWARSIMRFLVELDGDLTVEEIRAALEDYR